MVAQHTLELLSSPHSLDLATLAALKREINLGLDTAHDEFLLSLLGEASSEVEGIVGYHVNRAHVRESFAGDGASVLQLDRRPVWLLTEVKYQGVAQSLSGFDILAPDQGQLVAVGGWTASIRRDWAASYWGGWLLPGDNLSDAGLTASSVDNSFNDPAGHFPTVLPGEWVRAATGWLAANQGQHKVVSATSTKIVTSSVLVSDSGSATKILGFSTLPGAISRACLTLVKIRFHGRDRDPSLKRGVMEAFVDSTYDVEAALRRVWADLAPYIFVVDTEVAAPKLPALFAVL